MFDDAGWLIDDCMLMTADFLVTMMQYGWFTKIICLFMFMIVRVLMMLMMIGDFMIDDWWWWWLLIEGNRLLVFECWFWLMFVDILRTDD